MQSQTQDTKAAPVTQDAKKQPPPTGIGAKGPSKTQAKLSAGKAARSALERLDDLEGRVFQLTFGTQQGFNEVQQDMTALSEFVDACVELVGRDAIQSKIQETRVAKATKAMEEMKVKLENAVQEEIMLPIAVVTPACLLVGTQRNPAGEIVPPGRIQIAFSELGPEVAALFKDKAIGTTVELSDKSTFHIIGLFEPNPNPPKKEAPPAEGTPPAESAEKQPEPAPTAQQ